PALRLWYLSVVFRRVFTDRTPTVEPSPVYAHEPGGSDLWRPPPSPTGAPAAPSRRVDRRVGSGPTHIKPPGGQRSVAGRVRPGIHSAPTWTSARSSGKCRVRAPACARSPR